MSKSSKPWLNYSSDAPVREYSKRIRKKRSYRWALFWLVLLGHCGAHRLYLWDAKKAGLIILFYFFSFFTILFISALLLLQLCELPFDVFEGISLTLAQFVPWILIILFELPRLKHNVHLTNQKHLLF